MSYPVKFYSSGMLNSPVLANNWGDLVTLLDACLINGFGLTTLDSITFDASTGIATASISAGHGFSVNQVLEITGADQPEYNGEHSVLSVTVNTFTFAVTGTPVTPATTSTQLSAKVAPLGWEAPYRADYKVAYRSKSAASPKNMLLVDDRLKTPNYTTTWAKWANVGIVEDMSDINTIVGKQAPYDAAKPTKNWQQVEANQWGWYKWYHARMFGYSYENSGDGGAGARNWVLIGDDRLFYLFLEPLPNTSLLFYLYGDINSYKPDDQYATALAAKDVYLGNGIYLQSPYYYGNLIASNSDAGAVLLCSYTQLGGPISFSLTSLNINNNQTVSGRGAMIPFPNGPDYSLWLLPFFVKQSDGHMRGTMPGLYFVPHNLPYPHLSVVDNVVGQPGRRFLMVSLGYESISSNTAQVAIDITGPWR